MNINNFSGGIISAAAYTRLRDISASDAGNVEHDDEGALVTKAGHRRVSSDREAFVSIFAHWGFVLAVTADGELKWQTEALFTQTDASRALFRSFTPPRTGFDTIDPTDYATDENVVFISNAYVQLKVTLENGEDPIAYPFYLPHPGPFAFQSEREDPIDGQRRQFSRSVTGRPTRRDRSLYQVDTDPDGTAADRGDGVFVRLQVIKTLSQDGDDALAYPIEAVGPSGTIEGKLQGTFFQLIILAEQLELDTDADYIDIFQSLSTAENEDTDYYFIGRVPYAAGTYGLRIFDDAEIQTERLLVEPLDEPAWRLSARSNERIYANTGNDNIIWMTYWESGEKYLRTFTDQIPVNTGGFPITGLKLLQQNALTVYTENRIFLLNVDPIAELHRVTEVISTKDDKDAPIGCIAPESLVDVNGYHYFLSSNRQVYRFGGQRVTWVSDTINPTLAKMPRALAKKAIGFARGLHYCLVYPSTPESTDNDAILCYDTPRKIWWKDDLGIAAYSRGQSGAEYALIDSLVVLLNVGTLANDAPIEWFWRGNKVLLPLNTLIHSLFIGGLPEDIGIAAIALSVKLKTEEGEQTQTMTIESAVDFWEQIVGFNLRGRSVQVELSGVGRMKIDRLAFNPEP